MFGVMFRCFLCASVSFAGRVGVAAEGGGGKAKCSNCPSKNAKSTFLKLTKCFAIKPTRKLCYFGYCLPADFNVSIPCL